MSNRNKDDEQTFYVCGQCDTKIFNLKTDESVIPCPECGWWHKDRKKDDIRFPIKIDLTQY